MHTFDYDSNYEPAMPTVEIAIGRALAPPTLVLSAVVDSGADASLVPIRHLKQIGARKAGKAWMRGTTGSRARVDIFHISLALGDHHQGQLEAIANAVNDEVIIGREVLNQLIVTLNSLAHEVQVTS